MLADDTAPLSEIAAALKRSEDWLRRNWRRLRDESGFPLPIYGMRDVWPREAVKLWLRAGGHIAKREMPAGNDNAPEGLVSMQNAALRERYQAEA